MKRVVLVLALAFVMLLALTSGAYAVRGDSTYLTTPGSPHGAYTTTTQKCGVCHAVHHATATGEALLRSSIANACVYCHITSSTGRISIYNGVEANYNGADYSNAHNNYGTDPATCTGCHQVHAASNVMSGITYLDGKILKDLSSGTTSQTPVFNSGNTDEANITQFCIQCHGYYETNYDTGTPTTHIMGPAGSSYGNPQAGYSGRVAWNGSDYCYSCHASGDKDQADGTVKTVASSWPHYTAGDRFLLQAASSTAATSGATDSRNDGVCLRCHTDGTNGVGIDF